MYLTSTVQLKITERNIKNCLKFPDFSSTCSKFHSFSRVFEIPWLENAVPFPGFPVDVGTMHMHG